MTWSMRSITKTMLPVLAVLTSIEIAMGLVLSSFESTLFQYPSLLVLVPVIIGTAGSLGSTLSARLSTAFHLGLLEFKFSNYHLTGNILSTMALSITIFPLIGAITWVVSTIVFEPLLGLSQIVLITTFSGILISIFTAIIALITTYSSYLLRLDPDDGVIPTVTNLCDVFGIFVLLTAIFFLI